MTETGKTIAVIAGPTASGKSARALELAKERGGVIINADALQVYDALPILTAQPSAEDKTAVPHRLYGVLSANERCSAARWCAMAAQEIDAALAAGALPIVTGGTGFYIKALMEGLSPMPDIPPGLREALSEELEKIGNAAFHAKLRDIDPQTASRLVSGDSQRLIRAREVWEATGKPLSWWQAQPRRPVNPAWRFSVELIMPERDELRRRCDQRFLAMLEAGALDEVEALSRDMEEGRVSEDSGIKQALGFEALRKHIKGELSRAEAVERAQTQTRQYARRQVTWFRHQLR